MKKTIVVSLLLCVLIPAACSSFAQPTPMVVPTPSFAAVPNRTATHTPTPASTLLPALAFEWNGIPIMPGAVAGEGDEESYVFTIQATPQQIWEYYELELGKLGWKASVQEVGDNYLTLVFTQVDATTLTVSIIAKGEDALVLLVK